MLGCRTPESTAVLAPAAPWDYLDIGSMDLSQEDLLRLQAAQLAQQLLQPRVFLIHVQPQPVPHWRGAVQFNDCTNNTAIYPGSSLDTPCLFSLVY